MTARWRAVRRLILIAAVVLGCGVASVARASQFLAAETERALAARSEFMGLVGLTDAEFLVFGQWIQENDRAWFDERLSYQSGTGNTWYYFLSGLMNPDAASAFFMEALTAASGDPGTLWLLALEFLRNDQSAWAAGALTELEKNIFARGASSAPLLSRQLMLFGSILAPDYPADAEFCYTWAKRFDGDQPWWVYKKGLVGSPRSLISAIPAFIAETAKIFLRSWNMQAAFAYWAYRLLAVTLFFFMCAVFLAYLVKYLPSGVHFIGDTLFSSALPRYRTVSSAVIVLSILPFGLIPFLWTGAFLIRRFMSAPEKKLLTCVCVILALCPFDAVIANLILRHTAPASTAVIFDRVVKEGYSERLHGEASALAEKNGDNYLAQLAVALSAAKDGHYRQSADALRRAHQLRPSDPMVLMHAGNISFWAGNTEAMEQFHGQLLAKQPGNAEAMFNLAQSQFVKGGFSASDKIAEAAKIKPELISGFMKVNDSYYGNDTPPLRKLIQPAIAPGYFWQRVFASDIGGALKVPQGQRRTFGVSPLAALAVSAALLALLLAFDATVWNTDTKSGKRYFVCRICGCMICRKCRKGTMCLACYKASLDSHNNAATMFNLQKRHQDNAQLTKDLIRHALGMAVPGTDRLYRSDAVWGPAARTLATGAVFAALYCAAAFTAAYPSLTVINPVYYVSVLLIYNVVAFVKHVGGVVSVLRHHAKSRAKS